MITVPFAIYAHNTLIDEFGGSKGVRDMPGLEAALNRPFVTFDGQDLYATPTEKAAALLESLIINHPFVDGNKRIAYTLTELLLVKYNIRLEASFEEKYPMVIAASCGEIRFEEIKTWLESKIKPTP